MEKINIMKEEAELFAETGADLLDSAIIMIYIAQIFSTGFKSTKAMPKYLGIVITGILETLEKDVQIEERDGKHFVKFKGELEKKFKKCFELMKLAQSNFDGE